MELVILIRIQRSIFVAAGFRLRLHRRDAGATE
jgi:hypothetical protein